MNILLYKKPINIFYKVDTKIENIIDIPENEIFKYVSKKDITDSLSEIGVIMSQYSQYNHEKHKSSKTFYYDIKIIQMLPLKIFVDKFDGVPYISIFIIHNYLSEKYYVSIKNYVIEQISCGAGGNGHMIVNKKGSFLFFLDCR